MVARSYDDSIQLSSHSPVSHRDHQKRTELFLKLECGPMPNVMAALPNIGGALSLKFVGVPQTPEPISAVSGPKFTILSGHVEEVLLLNKFFSDCRYMAYLRRNGPTKLCDSAEMAIFCVLYLQ